MTASDVSISTTYTLDITMSKTQRSQEVGTIGQLKKELGDAASSIQALKTRIGSIEQALVDSTQARDAEKTLNETIDSLRTSLQELQAETRTKEDAFATSTLSLDISFGKRLQGYKDQFAREANTKIEQYATQQEQCQAELDRTREENRVLQNRQQSTESDLEACVKDNERLVNNIKNKNEIHVKKMAKEIEKLKAKNDELNRDIEEQTTILRGRNTEIQRLDTRLASLEHFSEFSEER